MQRYEFDVTSIQCEVTDKIHCHIINGTVSYSKDNERFEKNDQRELNQRRVNENVQSLYVVIGKIKT